MRKHVKYKNVIYLFIIIFICLFAILPNISEALESTGNETVDAFINDSRWTDGASYAYNQRPKLASFDAWGCCAYCADYVKYCHGFDDPSLGEYFNDIDEIQAGDVLNLVHPWNNGHWLVVLKRDGNSLYTAEGNCKNTVRIGWGYYSIDDGSLSSLYAGYHYPIDTNSNPDGSVDVIKGGNGTVTIEGWAYDPDSSDTPVSIHVYVGGEAGSGATGYTTDIYGNSIVANNYRSDLDRYWGFKATIYVDETGDQPIYVYAINNEEGHNPQLDYTSGVSNTVNVSYGIPIGYVELVEGENGRVTISGWTYDPDNANKSVSLHVYVGGVCYATDINGNEIIADKYRSDLGRNCGFVTTIYVGNRGSQSIYVFALNNDDPGRNKQLPLVEGISNTVDVSKGKPLGYVDKITGGNGTITIKGWVYDPDSENKPVSLHVYVGGVAGSGASCYYKDINGNAIVAGNERLDVGRNCGFEATIDVEERENQLVYIYALDNEDGYNPEIPLAAGVSNSVYIENYATSGCPTTNINVGVYIFHTAIDDSKCLNISDGSCENNANIEICEQNDKASCEFYVNRNGDGFVISNTKTKKSVDVANASRISGSNIQQYESNNEINQRWFFENAGDGYVYIRSGLGTYIDVDGEETENGANVIAHYWNGGINQKFRLERVNVINNTQILDVTPTGYTVSCEVMDGYNITKVQFPTWTDYNGQDDIASNWDVNSEVSGTKSGKNYSFRVNVSDHNYEYGLYKTHIYSFDENGYSTCVPLNITVEDTLKPVATVVYNGHRYDLYDNYRTWSEAKAICEEKGGCLASITTAEEQQVIEGLISNGTGHQRNQDGYWIGGKRTTNGGDFAWISGESFSYENWDSVQPDNNDGSEDVIQIYSTNELFGKWNDNQDASHLEKGLGFICETDISEIGDINQDGVLDIKDARIAKRIAMKDPTVEGEYTEAGFNAGDLDGNGKITVNEARKIKRVVLGEDSF